MKIYRCSLGSYWAGGQGPVYALFPEPFAPAVPAEPFSEISRVSGDMLKSVQWSKTPSGFNCFGTSGSSTMSASDFVPSGTPPNESGGLTLSPSQVYFDGMVCPSSNAELLRVSVDGIFLFSDTAPAPEVESRLVMITAPAMMTMAPIPTNKSELRKPSGILHQPSVAS